MARAMIEILPRSPKWRAGKRVQIAPGNAIRKFQARNRNHPLQNPREGGANLVRLRANCDGSRNIGGTIQILATAIHQHDLSGLKLPV